MLQRYILSILFAALTCLPVLSQNIRFDHLTNENGLSQNSVNYILQDRRGFIWIGTADGLNRYDGVNFRVYRHNAYDSNSLSTNTVIKMHEDKLGYIWVATYMGGLSRYDPGKDNFTVFRHNDNDTNSISFDQVASICEDKDSNLWILTNTGFDKYDRKNNKFIHLFKRNTGNPICVVLIDKNDNLSIGFINREVMVYKIQGNALQFQEKFIPLPEKKKAVFNGIYQSSDGIYWFITAGQGLIGYDKEKKKSFQFIHSNNSKSISYNNLTSITEDKEGNLWIGTWNNGLDKFDRKRGLFTNYKHDPVNKYSLSNNSVYSVFIDKNNILWISTYGDGVDKYDVYKNKFCQILYSTIPGKGLNDPWVFPVSEDKTGRLWVGTLYGGINIYDRNTNKYPHNFFLGPKSITQKSYILRSIEQDLSGNIYAGDMYGLTKIDPITLNMTRIIFLSKQVYTNEAVKYILRDKENIFWLATNVGLVKYNLSTGKSIQYSHDPGNKNSIGDNFLETIFKDKNGIIWAGTTSRGLDRFDESNNRFSHYENNPLDRNSLSHNQVSVIYEDSKNNLWVGTKGGGLNRLNRRKNTFEHIYSNDGLSNDVIYGILEDDNNNLWISTNNGLSKYNFLTSSFKNYDISDGLINNEFNTNSYFKNEKGEMFFGCVGGVIYFHPGKIIENKYIPPVVITSMHVNHNAVKNLNDFIQDPDDSGHFQKNVI
jgi:ligand-binding sensor domain-containing protein